MILLLALLAAPELVASFDDPAGDVAYAAPLDSEFSEGDFDLRRFAVYQDGEEVIFEVTLGAPIRRPQVTRRTNSTELQFLNGIYLQNIDIYLDTDRAAGSGFSVCVPGRRVAFADGRTWEKAVVLTPQPGPARAITQGALGKAAEQIIFAENVQSQGRTITARVPLLALGSRPRKEWGYSVHVSGARWDRTFDAAGRLGGRHEADAFTMPVLSIPGPWAFGGAPEGNRHPRVVDVLLPLGIDQKAVLSSFTDEEFARVPFVDAVPSAAAAAVAAKPPAGLTVTDIVNDMVSVSGPVSGVRKLQFGRVLAPDGSTVAHLVVVQILEAGLLTSIVDGREKIVRGARVVFDGR
jgi:hypothetical protein